MVALSPPLRTASNAVRLPSKPRTTVSFQPSAWITAAGMAISSDRETTAPISPREKRRTRSVMMPFALSSWKPAKRRSAM